MKLAATIIFAFGLGGISLGAVAAEPAKTALPDPDYCARRDADPEKCVIQNGPPHRHVVRKKQGSR